MKSKCRAAGWAALVLAVAGTSPCAMAETRGYAQPVTQSIIQAKAQALFGKALIGAGLPAHVQSCRLIEQVAVGVRNSDTAYGGACRIAFGNRPAREFVLCTSDMSGGLDLYENSFVNTPEWMEAFVRKNCFDAQG